MTNTAGPNSIEKFEELRELVYTAHCEAESVALGAGAGTWVYANATSFLSDLTDVLERLDGLSGEGVGEEAQHGERHPFEPEPSDITRCQVCGHDRHHPWHS